MREKTYNFDKQTYKKRQTSLECVRIIALWCVISVHFFLKNGFYDEKVIGLKMYIAVIARSGFMICVPLFIILTGYLMNQKQLSAKYYLGITKTIMIYILSSVACILYKHIFLEAESSVSEDVFSCT